MGASPVDDGSSDETVAAISRRTDDPRIRLSRSFRRGIGGAQRRTVAARGDLVVYLDSDVRLYPDYLNQLVRAYAADPGLEWAYAARRMELLEDDLTVLELEPFDRARLERYNYIDCNVISHRRGLEERLGGWDPALVVGSDWDLALRWSATVTPRPLPILAVTYDLGRPDQLTLTAPAGFAHHRVTERHRRRRRLPLRVLYAVSDYPQLTESYIEQEIRAAEAHGVEVEVWSFLRPAAPHATTTKVHEGPSRRRTGRCSPTWSRFTG
ncbi:MAG: glycosyltransferase [Thermoanaerobaculia bacterium]